MLVGFAWSGEQLDSLTAECGTYDGAPRSSEIRDFKGKKTKMMTCTRVG